MQGPSSLWNRWTTRSAPFNMNQMSQCLARQSVKCDRAGCQGMEGDNTACAFTAEPYCPHVANRAAGMRATLRHSFSNTTFYSAGQRIKQSCRMPRGRRDPILPTTATPIHCPIHTDRSRQYLFARKQDDSSTAQCITSAVVGLRCKKTISATTQVPKSLIQLFQCSLPPNSPQ